MPLTPKLSDRVFALSTDPDADTVAVTVARVTRAVGADTAGASRPPPLRDAYATPAPATRSTASAPLSNSALRFVDSFTSLDSATPRWNPAGPFLNVS
ncbi:hypothetical protein GCM10010106_29230 [Thermopolyspora flexuosa]|nr:hypothetical protein GCM10010106_29230 [Thermopolyspora flexuosa]